MTAHPNQRAADELRGHLDALLAIEESKDTLAARKADEIAVMKARGFDAKALLLVVRRLREETADRKKREATAAMAEVYAATLDLAALGGFGARGDDGLSPGARGAIDGARAPAPDGEPQDPADAPPLPPASDAPQAPTDAEIEAAHARGAADFRAGVKILNNPYPAGDPRRGAWDRGWCQEGATDGMEIPAHLRRSGLRKKDAVAAEPVADHRSDDEGEDA